MANNQLVASDSFASGSLAAGWSAWPSLSESAVVVGSPTVTQPSAISTTQGEYWTGTTFPNDQVCEAVVNNVAATGNAGIVLGVRIKNNGGSQGYGCVINPTNGASGSVVIVRYTAGVSTQIAATTVALTFTAGDVWTFAAFGSCLVVYQNGTRLLYIGDATYTSGSPGIVLASNSTAATTAQISAFRGYSYAQQDGVWAKKGVVLAANATELGNATIGTGLSGFLGMSFGPARFLSGNVYRGYFVNGLGVNYAESVDGVTWQRYSGNPIISSTYGVDVFFHSGTYYLWCQATPGTSVPNLYTSTNGLTFTSQGATNLPTGYYAGVHVIDFIAGTFYALISKLAASTLLPSTYLITSTDGLNWSFANSGSPIITGAFCGCQISKVGGAYYFWATANQIGQGNSGAPDFDPYEAVRYKSTNATTWTLDTKSAHNSLLVDSYNINTGGVAPCAVINVGNKATMYYQGGPNDNLANQIYQVEMAQAPTNLAQLVQFPESATAQTASDAFARSAGGLGSNWTTPTGATALAIASSGVVEPSALNVECVGLYTAKSFPTAQYSEVTILTLIGVRENQYIIPVVLAQSNALSFYGLQLTTATGSISIQADFCIFKKVNNSNTILGSTPTSPNNITLSVGDVIRFAARQGSDGSIILTVYQNGFQVLEAQDYAATFTSGAPGVFMFATNAIADSQISLWAGGNSSQLPSYGPSGTRGTRSK